jgi:hypothetical protein
MASSHTTQWPVANLHDQIMQSHANSAYAVPLARSASYRSRPQCRVSTTLQYTGIAVFVAIFMYVVLYYSRRSFNSVFLTQRPTSLPPATATRRARATCRRSASAPTTSLYSRRSRTTPPPPRRTSAARPMPMPRRRRAAAPSASRSSATARW